MNRLELYTSGLWFVKIKEDEQAKPFFEEAVKRFVCMDSVSELFHIRARKSDSDNKTIRNRMIYNLQQISITAKTANKNFRFPNTIQVAPVGKMPIMKVGK